MVCIYLGLFMAEKHFTSPTQGWWQSCHPLSFLEKCVYHCHFHSFSNVHLHMSFIIPVLNTKPRNTMDHLNFPFAHILPWRHNHWQHLRSHLQISASDSSTYLTLFSPLEYFSANSSYSCSIKGLKMWNVVDIFTQFSLNHLSFSSLSCFCLCPFKLSFYI